MSTLNARRDEPLVSICMTVYNEVKFVRHALASLIAQDYANVEIIVYDNCSNDGTWEALQDIASASERVKVFRQSTNVGGPRNAETAMRIATGEFLMIAAGHDYWHPRFVSACVAELLQDANAIMAYPRALWVDVQDKPIGPIPTNIDTRGMDPASRLHVVLWGVGYGYQMYGLFRRSFFTGWKAKAMLAPDNLLLAKAALLGSFVQVPETLFHMRRMDDYGSWESYVSKIFSRSLHAGELSATRIYGEMICEFIGLIEEKFPAGFQRDALVASVVMCLSSKYQHILHGVSQAAGGADLSGITNDITQFAHDTANAARMFSTRHRGNTAIIVDAVFFQIYHSGIARVWRSLLEQWSGDEFSRDILVLDREGTAPRIKGIRYRTISAYDYDRTDADKAMLQQICDEERAALFISSYYTTPISTPSVFMAHDMVPEVAGWDLNLPMWREKHHAIRHAIRHFAVSRNTARDLARFFPEIRPADVPVIYNGVDFSPSQNVAEFKARHGIVKPYFLLVGVRTGYKNAILFFRAFAQLGEERADYEIVCTGSQLRLEAESAALAGRARVHMLQLDEEEMQAAYSGALALVYPSTYEGFGLPIVEAMACGCPVITCPVASIPEAAGDAAIYVQPDDVPGLTRAMRAVQQPQLRTELVTKGLDQARNFSWAKMADEIKSLLLRTREQLPGDMRTAAPAAALRQPTASITESVLQARRWYETGKVQEAVDMFERILAVDPDNVDAFHFLGIIALQSGQDEEAELFIRRAIAIKPDFADPHNNLGLLYIGRGKPREAEECFAAALKLNPLCDATRQNLERARAATGGAR
jgi:glycosyltransferase involved in cell wall biosynthesis